MTRVLFHLRVDPSKLDEYRARHAAVWPEMLEEIAASGRRDYTLWLTDDGLLTGVYEADDPEAATAYLAQSEVAARWEAYMAELFTDLPGGRADQGAQEPPEVFDLETQLTAARAATDAASRGEH